MTPLRSLERTPLTALPELEEAIMYTPWKLRVTIETRRSLRKRGEGVTLGTTHEEARRSSYKHDTLKSSFKSRKKTTITHAAGQPHTLRGRPSHGTGKNRGRHSLSLKGGKEEEPRMQENIYPHHIKSTNLYQKFISRSSKTFELSVLVELSL